MECAAGAYIRTGRRRYRHQRPHHGGACPALYSIRPGRRAARSRQGHGRHLPSHAHDAGGLLRHPRDMGIAHSAAGPDAHDGAALLPRVLGDHIIDVHIVPRIL